jgi:hypothetical protein
VVGTARCAVSAALEYAATVVDEEQMFANA